MEYIAENYKNVRFWSVYYQRNGQNLAKGGQRRSQLWLVAVADCVFDWRGSSAWLAYFRGSKFCKVLLSKQIMFSP